MPSETVKSIINSLVAASIFFDEEQCYLAAELVSSIQQYHLPYPDRASLALAKIHNCKILTANQALQNIKIEGITIESIK